MFKHKKRKEFVIELLNLLSLTTKRVAEEVVVTVKKASPDNFYGQLHIVRSARFPLELLLIPKRHIRKHHYFSSTF